MSQIWGKEVERKKDHRRIFFGSILGEEKKCKAVSPCLKGLAASKPT
jgi:hypothetical protein